MSYLHASPISRKFYQLFFACVMMQSNGILFQHSKHNWKRLHCWTKIFLKRYACICILLYNVHTQQTKYMQKQSTMHSGNTKNTTITWHNWNSLHWWNKLFHRDTHAYTTVHYTTVQYVKLIRLKAQFFPLAGSHCSRLSTRFPWFPAIE